MTEPTRTELLATPPDQAIAGNTPSHRNTPKRPREPSAVGCGSASAFRRDAQGVVSTLGAEGKTVGSRDSFFGDAYQKGFRKTVAFLRRLEANSDLATELAQAAWVRGWERLRELRDDRRIDVWIASIAHNLLRDHRRLETRFAGTLPAGSEPQAAADVDFTAIDIERALDDERQKDLLKAVYVEGKTAAEVAEALGISVGAVHTRVSRLRATLRSRLATA